MKQTVRELIEILQNFPNQEQEVIASIWGKEDFDYALELLGECPEDYELTQAQVDEADPMSLWEENAGMVERITDQDAEYLNDNIFSMVLASLKGENNA